VSTNETILGSVHRVHHHIVLLGGLHKDVEEPHVVILIILCENVLSRSRCEKSPDLHRLTALKLNVVSKELSEDLFS